MLNSVFVGFFFVCVCVLSAILSPCGKTFDLSSCCVMVAATAGKRPEQPRVSRDKEKVRKFLLRCLLSVWKSTSNEDVYPQEVSSCCYSTKFSRSLVLASFGCENTPHTGFPGVPNLQTSPPERTEKKNPLIQNVLSYLLRRFLP